MADLSALRSAQQRRGGVVAPGHPLPRLSSDLGRAVTGLITPDRFDALVDRIGAESAAELMSTVAEYLEGHRACTVTAVDIDAVYNELGDVRVTTNFRHTPGCPDAHRPGGDHP